MREAARPQLAAARPAGAWASTRRLFRRHGALVLMALPGLVVLFVFSYLPMPGIILAFKDYKAARGIWGSVWVGLTNFQFLFGTDIAWRIVRNTLFINALFIVSILVCALALALLLNEVMDTFVARIYQSILFFPFFVSYVIVGYFTFIFLSSDGGIVNGWLGALGMAPVNWFNTPGVWPLILVLINLWHNVGFNTIIYVAGLLAISPEYYEAARLDGANKWHEIWYIQLPLLRPLIVINVLLAIGRIFFANFDLFINATRMQGSLLSSTDVIDTYVFRTLTAIGNFNMASAAGLFQAAAGFALIVLANWIVRRLDSDQALF